MNFHDLLVTPIGHLAPHKLLEGLSADDAHRRLPDTVHTVAEIVAHVTFWQDWFYARCLGEAVPMIASAATGWPPADGSWPDVRARFLDRLEGLAALGDQDATRRVDPPIEFPPLADYTIGDALVHVATHNAHHLGQVVILRQQMKAWPPPAGSWTW